MPRQRSNPALSAIATPDTNNNGKNIFMDLSKYSEQAAIVAIVAVAQRAQMVQTAAESTIS